MASIKILEEKEKEGKMTFQLSNATPAFANAIRRTMIEDVPTMAIEEVEFSKNSSVLYDEIVAHRLGLIPLSTDLETYTLPDQCKCGGEGCARCTLELSLSATEPGVVKAGSMQSKDPKVVPVFPETPILKLKKNQDFEFVAKAVLGKGKNHAKWIPGNVWYTYKPKITINQKSEKLQDFKHLFPQEIFDKNGKIIEEKLQEPHIRDACEGVCDDVIHIEYDDTSFIFHVESWGQLTPRTMLYYALDILGNELDEFAQKVGAIA